MAPNHEPNGLIPNNSDAEPKAMRHRLLPPRPGPSAASGNAKSRSRRPCRLRADELAAAFHTAFALPASDLTTNTAHQVSEPFRATW